MRFKSILPFKISSMDSLGQGVSKESDKITFIPKTLPGEEGNSEILSEKKGVAFAKAISITITSPERIKPECVHFSDCPSCHYLHTNYQSELSFKKENLAKLLRKLVFPEIKTIGAKRRLHYRNRIQLHYDTTHKLLGVRDVKSHRILPIPQCLIAEPEIQAEIKRLYFNNQWIKELNGSSTGHVEIYQTSEGLKVNWNRPYAEGGFTQVFEEMNQELKKELKLWSEKFATEDLLDLFGGNGNLSQVFNYSRLLCVDYYQKLPTGEAFFSQDLYHEKALDHVQKEIKKRNLSIKTLLLDPPRSGMKELNLWCEAIKPQKIAYVSCDPHTLVRDLTHLQGYQIEEVYLIDFFPSTYHFETMIFLERKS